MNELEQETEIEKLRSKGNKEAKLIQKDIIYILKSIVFGILIISFIPIICLFI